MGSLLAYVLQRILLLVPTFLIGTSLIFFALRLLPGDEVTLIIGEMMISPEQRTQLEERYGLDEPLWERYGSFMGGVVRGDLGTSGFDGISVTKKVRIALPVTLELAVLATLTSVVVAIPVGVIAALYRDTPLDYLLRIGANLSLAAPTFWIATMILLTLTLWVGWTPNLRYEPIWEDPAQNIKQFLLPALILGTALSASIMRFTRSMMLDVLGEDYVRTAHAKGLHSRTVIFRHALRNALLPVITVVGVQVILVMSGSVIIESIFLLPGMGIVLLRAVDNRDFEVVQGINVVMLFVVLVLNLGVDLSYTLIDPRVKLQG